MGRFTRTLGPTAAITAAIALWIAVMVTVSASAATRQNGVAAPKSHETAATTPAPATAGAGVVAAVS